MKSYRTIAVDVQGRVGRLTLNRPQRGNALNLELARELTAALRRLEEGTGVDVLVITGAGKLFCAGGDVHEMATAESTADYVAELIEEVNRAAMLLHSSRLVTVAALNGSAAGAGLGLMLHTDFRVTSDAASFQSAYGAVGLTPDCGVSVLLPIIVGAPRASSILLAGERLGAATALEYGLVDEVAVAGELEAAVERRVASILALAPQSLSATRQLMRRPLKEEHAARLDEEAQTIISLAAHPDTQRRLREFANRG